MRLRVWSEFLDLDELCSPEVVDLLGRFDVNLCVKTTDHERLGRLLRTYADRGLEVGVWLLLPKSEGYWPSERNASLFAKRVDALLAWAADERVAIPWLAVDLEPPLWQAVTGDSSAVSRRLMRAWHTATNLNRRRFLAARSTYRAVAARAQQGGVRLLCAASAYVRDDLLAGSSLMQDVHEAPVLGVPWDVISVMVYTSMDPAPPADARRWLYDVARDVVPYFGRRTGVSIGLTSAGVLGNEPHYTDPQELAPDVAALKAVGVEDVAIYSLEGIIRSPNPGAWFEVARSVPPLVPPSTPGSRRRSLRRILRAVLRAVG